jgi:hypothetical protein
MAITTQEGYIIAKANARAIPIQKTSLANQAAGNFVSMFRAAGVPAQPAIPGAAAVCTSATPGALLLPAVSGSNLRYLEAVNLTGTVAGIAHIVDRIIHSGGLSGVVFTPTVQTINTPALPARAPVFEVEWFLECYTDLGATGVNATFAVTYDDASTGNVVVAIPATLRAGRMLPINPAVSGRAIRSIESVTLSASTTAAGSFGVTCIDRIGAAIVIPIANGGGILTNMIKPIDAAACLMVYLDASTTNSGDVRGSFVVIEG